MVNDSQSTGNETERLQTAASWHARLEDGAVSETDFVAFTAWLETDPRNRKVFDTVDAAASDAIEVLSLNRELALAGTQPRARQGLLRRAVFAAGGLAAVMLVAVIARPEFLMKTERMVVATAAGESRDVILADGSTVHLNTKTQISVAMNSGSRAVVLDHGEALFEVVSDNGRPFDVMVGDRRVRVVGTAFNVLRHDGRITVTVERGKVDVLGTDRAAVRLQPGEQFAAREGAAAYQVAKIDPAAAAAWRDGRAVFNNTPLSEVVSDLSRYYGKPITVRDPAVGGLRFSGILKIEDQGTTVRRLEALLPIVVVENGDEVRLERGSSTK